LEYFTKARLSGISPGGLLSTGTGATDRTAEPELEGAARVLADAEAEGRDEALERAVEVGPEPEVVLLVPLQALTAARTAIETARADSTLDFTAPVVFIPAA
jgi:hypothetical protein